MRSPVHHSTECSEQNQSDVAISPIWPGWRMSVSHKIVSCSSVQARGTRFCFRRFSIVGNSSTRRLRARNSHRRRNRDRNDRVDSTDSPRPPAPAPFFAISHSEASAREMSVRSVSIAGRPRNPSKRSSSSRQR